MHLAKDRPKIILRRRTQGKTECFLAQRRGGASLNSSSADETCGIHLPVPDEKQPGARVCFDSVKFVIFKDHHR